MRLSKLLESGRFEFTKDLEDDELPPYAILSHTWGPDEGEVKFADVIGGTGQHKAGYRKLDFCAEQTRRDALSYFWADTCCIDKTNSVELNTAITSMFRWYQQAAKCYVYLPDVLCSHQATSDNDGGDWISDFRSSRWLTRGWTLQELIAPQVVEFFDRNGVKLGDKLTLERHLCEITGVPAQALRGRELSSFSMAERLSWQARRSTKKPEDRAYSLLGICGVSIIPSYGEGKDNAMKRLRAAIDDASKGVCSAPLERLIC
jgi:hypothetical protein